MSLVEEVYLRSAVLGHWRMAHSFVEVVVVQVLSHVGFLLPTGRSLPLIELIKVRSKLALPWSVITLKSFNPVAHIREFALHFENLALAIIMRLSAEILSKLSSLKHVLLYGGFLGVRGARSLSDDETSVVRGGTKVVSVGLDLRGCARVVGRGYALEDVFVVVHGLA